MSASEKLKALTLTATPDVTVEVPIRLVHVLPQIVAVVEAAEDGRGLLLRSEPTGVEMVGWPVEKAQALQTALSALDEALGETDRSDPA